MRRSFARSSWSLTADGPGGVRSAFVDQTVVIWPVFLANQVEMLLPKTVRTAISAIATRATRTPYSVTAIPSSERKNFFIRGILRGGKIRGLQCNFFAILSNCHHRKGFLSSIRSTCSMDGASARCVTDPNECVNGL